MTSEQIRAQIRGLLAERAGYEARGLYDQAELVTRELRLLAAKAQGPAQRASRRFPRFVTRGN